MQLHKETLAVAAWCAQLQILQHDTRLLEMAFRAKRERITESHADTFGCPISRISKVLCWLPGNLIKAVQYKEQGAKAKRHMSLQSYLGTQCQASLIAQHGH